MEPINGKKGISGSTIKMIAIITMLIDHVAAAVLDRVLISKGLWEANTSVETARQFMQDHIVLYTLDSIMRMIGRISFPIFCFLLIEGFLHTHNLKKYIGRMLLFAVVSEIPFDLAFMGKVCDFGYQNVFLTLAVGLLVLTGFQLVGKREEMHRIVMVILHGLILAAGMGTAFLIKSDYGAYGVLTIAVMYLLRKNRVWELLAGCTILTVMSFIEFVSFIVILPVHFYNGRKGWNMKYFFYFFYPVHLLILYMICRYMGIADIAVI